MFEPVRGGTRGGQAEFKWSDVSADKDRENYLGHSINAPTGRWQKNKDIHWYNRDVTQDEAERQEEIRKVKELEADALAVALGFEPAPKGALKPSAAPGASTTATGSNSIAVAAIDVGDRAREKEEKRRKKAQRKEEKRTRKEMKRSERSSRHGREDLPAVERRRTVDQSRSRSPVRRHHTQSRERRGTGDHDAPSRRRSRSRTPEGRPSPTQISKLDANYDASEREREREQDRRRWDINSRRDTRPEHRW